MSLLPTANEVWGKVMFLQESVCPQGCMVSLPVCLTDPMFLSRGVSVSGPMCLLAVVSVQGEDSTEGGGSLGGSSVRETPQRESPSTVTSGRYASYWNVFLFVGNRKYSIFRYYPNRKKSIIFLIIYLFIIR